MLHAKGTIMFKKTCQTAVLYITALPESLTHYLYTKLFLISLPDFGKIALEIVHHKYNI